jgi:hypothetical protein
MAVNMGTRPGTKETQRIPGWDYTLATKPEWVAIRKDDREVQRFNSAVGTACDQLEKALIAANVAHVMLHGGHVDKGLLAKSGIRLDWSPGQVMAHIEGLLPKELASRALMS